MIRKAIFLSIISSENVYVASLQHLVDVTEIRARFVNINNKK